MSTATAWVEFQRAEHRRSSRRRELDCGCVIDAREPYRYYVAKVRELVGLVQQTDCDVCMRRRPLAGASSRW